jgi:hypothetical protein
MIARIASLLAVGALLAFAGTAVAQNGIPVPVLPPAPDPAPAPDPSPPSTPVNPAPSNPNPAPSNPTPSNPTPSNPSPSAEEEDPGPSPEELAAQQAAAQQRAREAAAARRRAAAARRRAAEARRREEERKRNEAAFAAAVSAVAPTPEALAGATSGVQDAMRIVSANRDVEEEGSALRITAILVLVVALLVGVLEVTRRRRPPSDRAPTRPRPEAIAARRRHVRAAVTVLACCSGAVFVYLIVNPSVIG